MKRSIPFLLYISISIFWVPLYSQVFWSEDFSEGVIPSSWENEDTNPQEDSEVLWQWCSFPEECPPFRYENIGVSGFGPFAAPTATNGYLYVDSDQAGNDYAGVHVSKLTTGYIDCSNYSKVYLQFYTHIATTEFEPSLNAKVNIYDGSQWIPYQVFPALDDESSVSVNPYIVSLDISEAAAGRSSVRLQWTWLGKYELSWAIDDIILSSEDPAAPMRSVWFERFAFGSGDWELNAVSPSNTIWEWDAAGEVSKGVLIPENTFINSRSASDGAMVFNADFYTTQGNPENIPNNPPYPFYVSELISPCIDLSNTSSPVQLQFTQLVQILNTAPDAPANQEGERFITSFAFSTDNGESWSDPIDLNPDLEPNTAFNTVDPLNSTEIIPLPHLEGESCVKIKFIWSGDFYFWVLDDISIAERPDYDMQLNRNFFAIMPNAITPVSQAGNESFLADVTNIGGKRATGVNLDLQISHDLSGTTIFEDTNFFGEVAVDQLIENVIFEDRLNAGGITHRGTYSGIYEVKLDSTDYAPQNNTVSWHFEISDTTFAKELGPTRNITSSETLSFSYGNCYFVPNGEEWYARFVTFGVSNASRLSGRPVNIYLYKWDGDLNGDRIANRTELNTPIGFNTYIFDGSEDDQLITIPIDLEGEGIALGNNSYYLLVVEYVAQISEPIFFLASEEFDYQATWFVTDSLERPRFASVLDLNNTGNFSLIGFGLDVVPVVRMHIGQTPDLSEPPLFTSVTRAEPAEIARFRVFPNPARTHFSIRVRLTRASPLLDLRVYDARGVQVFQQVWNNKQFLDTTLNASRWPRGVYFVKLLTVNGSLTKRVVLR